MKVNFQEIVKQKTDKELAIISKDYVFYSEEERLVALNELELRNSLTKELLMSKEDIETSPEIPIMTEQVLEAIKSTKKIYKDRAIWVGTFLGGPLVAGYFIAENFKAFNEIDKARKTWNYAVIGTLLIICGAFLLRDVNFPNQFLPFLYTLIVYFFVEKYQIRNISSYIALGGKSFSWWKTIAVGLIGFAITAILVIVFIILLYFIANGELN